MKKVLVISILFFLFSLLILACSAGGGGSSDGLDEDGDNILKIYTSADLDAVRGGEESAIGWDLSKSYILMNDIDLTGTDYVTGEGWVPLGTESTPFSGTFDGNGNTISGLVINRPAGDYQGLFGWMENATVKNLGVDCEITAHDYTGGLFGYSDNGNISNCSVVCVVVGNDYVGGIGGENYSGSITRSYSTFQDGNQYEGVTGHTYAGGFVGSNQDGIITECYSNLCSTASVAGGYSAGFAGQVAGTSIIRNSYSFGNSTGAAYSGGFIGNLAAGTVEYCHSLGQVTGTTARGFICLPPAVTGTANNYYSTDRSTCSDSNGATGLTSANLQVSSNLTGWDFSAIWNITGANGSFPHLRNNLPVF